MSTKALVTELLGHYHSGYYYLDNFKHAKLSLARVRASLETLADGLHSTASSGLSERVAEEVAYLAGPHAVALVMIKYKHSAEIQMAACRALLNLSVHPVARAAIVVAGAIGAVALAMANNAATTPPGTPNPTQLCGFGFFYNLLRAGGSAKRMEAARDYSPSFVVLVTATRTATTRDASGAQQLAVANDNDKKNNHESLRDASNYEHADWGTTAADMVVSGDNNHHSTQYTHDQCTINRTDDKDAMKDTIDEVANPSSALITPTQAKAAATTKQKSAATVDVQDDNPQNHRHGAVNNDNNNSSGSNHAYDMGDPTMAFTAAGTAPGQVEEERDVVMEIFRAGGLSAMWDAARTHLRQDSEERKAAEKALETALRVVGNSIRGGGQGHATLPAVAVTPV